MFNLAGCSLAQDRLDDALNNVNEALQALETTSSSIERAAALVLRASILARKGQTAEAEAQIAVVLSDRTEHLEDETLIDAAEIHNSFGSADAALVILDRLSGRPPATLIARRQLSNTRCTLLVREGRFKAAQEAFAEYPDGMATVVGGKSQRLFIDAYLASATGDSRAAHAAALAHAHAARQGAHAWRRSAELLIALGDSDRRLDEVVVVVGSKGPWHLTYLADLLVPELGRLSGEAVRVVHDAAVLHPARWRSSLRSFIARAASSDVLAPARLLEIIGEASDIPTLRAIGRTIKRGGTGGDLGRTLVRRLAHHVYVEDQGRVRLRVGNRDVGGTEIRRKVLALVCFLLTKQDLSATRDQVLDALWPDLDPELAQNSLNQTLYFLRRVFEEKYSDDLSPGYVRHDSDVIWLNPELVTSRSIECRELIRAISPRPSPDDVERLVQTYRGRFALDFEYEEWAGAYRDGLHAAFLEIVERSVLDDFRTGHFDRGIGVARRSLEIDPAAEQLEISLLRMYRASGAHAAAAEQYAHYASVMRAELGTEPPPLEAL
jgi:DNA-binding SARP family transcriptional activator